MRKFETKDAGRVLALDDGAESADATLPAFLARPKGAPVYHGFPVLDDVVVVGFTFGAITDFESHPSNFGDAFVAAPDNSRAGLVWEVSRKRRFVQICPPDEIRWGVWDLTFPFEMSSRENVRLNLEAILPKLKIRWERWRRRARREPSDRSPRNVSGPDVG